MDYLWVGSKLQRYWESRVHGSMLNLQENIHYEEKIGAKMCEP